MNFEASRVFSKLKLKCKGTPQLCVDKRTI